MQADGTRAAATPTCSNWPRHAWPTYSR